jgi:hypothetical protein
VRALSRLPDIAGERLNDCSGVAEYESAKRDFLLQTSVGVCMLAIGGRVTIGIVACSD